MKNERPEISIIAPGLLGASLALASKRLGLCKKINVWARREETRIACQQADWCDEVHESSSDAVKNADLVWVCSPVASIPKLLGQFASALKPGAVVSDVGSTKAKLVNQCETAIGEHGTFVGSHPMAGSEKSGFEYADPQLYNGKPCFVTPTKSTPTIALEMVENYWKALGMNVVLVAPQKHDEIVAHISHLPHLVASCMAGMLEEQCEESWKVFSGSGILDTTRVASGSVNMWKDIVEQNRMEIVPVLTKMIESMEHLKAHIESGYPDALVEMLEQGKEFRDSIEPEA